MIDIISSKRFRVIILKTSDIELINWITRSGGDCYFYDDICVVKVHPNCSFYNILSYLKNSYEPPRGIWQVGKYDIEID